MTVYKKKLSLTSHGGTPTFINITDDLRSAIAESGIQEGIATVISPHTTCGVFFEEFVHDVDETGTEFLQNDLNAVLEKIIPNQTDWNQYQYPGEEHYLRRSPQSNPHRLIGDLRGCRRQARRRYHGLLLLRRLRPHTHPHAEMLDCRHGRVNTIRK